MTEVFRKIRVPKFGRRYDRSARLEDSLMADRCGFHLSRFTRKEERGIILLIVLWVMIVLALLGTSFFHLASLEIMASRNDLDKFQARLLAESAIHLAEAVLVEEGVQGYHDLNSIWAGSGDLFEAVEFGEGVFQIYTADLSSEEGGTRFGLRDEASKLNLNTATYEMLRKLPGVTSQMAASILDWRDSDNNPRSGGAENDYYNSLSPSYNCRNAPFQSVGELLQVKGITPAVLFGEDANRDGVLQTAEDDGAENDPPDNGDGELNRGLLPFVTVDSYCPNNNADGLPRLNINTAAEADLRNRLEGKVSEQHIRKLLQVRKKTKFTKLIQLVSGVSEETRGRKGKKGRRRARKKRDRKRDSQGGRSGITAATGEGTVFSVEEFMTVLDELTVSDKEKLPGLVNINTAPKEVLLCLPGMTNQLVEKILERRSSEVGAFVSLADLARLEGMDIETFGEILPYITVRSTVFEALAVGYLPKKKAYASIEAKIDMGGEEPRVIYYRVMR